MLKMNAGSIHYVILYGHNLLSDNKKIHCISRSMIYIYHWKNRRKYQRRHVYQCYMTFFEKIRLQLRIYDQFYKMVFSYDLTIRNHNNKVLHCMMDDNHIYTLNYNIKRLEQLQDTINLDFTVTPSTDYIVRESERGKKTCIIQ